MKEKKRPRLPARLRRGGYATALVALLAVCCVLLCVAADTLETQNGWRVDYSFNALTTQSDVTRAVLAGLETPVHIYALATAGDEYLELIEILARYAAQCELVTYSVEDIVKNPGLLTAFPGDVESTVAIDSLIVLCAETGRYKIIQPTDYLSYGYNTQTGTYELTGLTYEKRITEAILYVSSDDQPLIQILTGHEELAEATTQDMEDMLVGYNYDVERVNLLTGGTLDPDALLMILSPLKDLTDAELQSILAFTRAGGPLFITSDFTDPVDMPNWNTLLRAYGFAAREGLVVGSEDDAGSVYNSSPAILIPYMQETDATAALLAAGRDVLLMAGARAFEMPAILDSSLRVQVVLESGENAYLRDVSQEEISLEQQESDPTGPFALALLSEWLQEDGTVSRAFIAGNSTMFTDSWLFTNTYASEFLLQMAQYLLGRAAINLEIVPKTALRPGLSVGSLTPGVLATVLLPVFVLLAAVIVLLPRRHL